MNYGFVPDENKIDTLLMRKEDSLQLDEWKTTLDEDEAQLAESTGNMVNVLKLRTKLKRAYPSDE